MAGSSHIPATPAGQLTLAALQAGDQCGQATRTAIRQPRPGPGAVSAARIAAAATQASGTVTAAICCRPGGDIARRR